MQGFSNPCIFGPRIDVGDSNIYSGIFYYMALAELDVIYLTMVAQNRKKFKLPQYNIISSEKALCRVRKDIFKTFV